MPAPILKLETFKADGEKLPAFRVSYPGFEKRILVLDERNNLTEEGDRDTFVNLCHKTCQVQKQSYEFIYTTLGNNGKSNIEDIIAKLEPDVVVFASDVLNTFFYRNKAPAFGRLGHSDRYDVDTILTVPFYKWARQSNPKKAKDGAQMLGFIVRCLVSAAEGRNLFSLDDDEIPDKPKTRLINTMARFKKFYKRLIDCEEVAIDSETESLARVTNKILTLQFAFDNTKGYVLPILHRETPWTPEELEYIRKKLRKWVMLSKSKMHLFHHAPFDIGQLMVWLDLPYYPADIYDTMQGHYAWDEAWKRMKNVAGIVKPYTLETLEELMGLNRDGITISKEDRANMSKFSLDEVAEYGTPDVCNLFTIRAKQIEMSTHPVIGYKSEEDYVKLVTKQLGVMSRVFTILQTNGIYMDTEYVFSLVQPGNQFDKAVEQIYVDIAETKEGKKANKLLMEKKGLSGGGLFAKKTTNILDLGKPDHRATLFFDVMGLEPVKIGKNGKGSTDKNFQKAYKDTVPTVAKLAQFNQITKLKNAFADAVAERVTRDPDFLHDNRLRSSYGSTGVDSGRTSSWDLNLQQIPAHGDLAKTIKHEFTVAHGRVMGAADFSAHEVRMSGVIAIDPQVKKTFLLANNAIRKFRLALEDVIEKAAKLLAEEGDIHVINVMFFFNEKIYKGHPKWYLRQQIKAIVFGTLYGKMAKGLAKELGIEQEAAQALIDVLFEKWENVATWIEDTHKTGKKTQKVYYPNLRIRHLWAYLSSDIWIQRAMDRVGVNAPIQGFSSDIGMVAVDEFNRWKYENCYVRGLNFDVLSINAVHDAQYWDSAFRCLPLTIYLTEHAMSTLPMDYFEKVYDFPITIPLSYGLEFGKSWDKMEAWSMRFKGGLPQEEGKRDLEKLDLLDRIRDYGKDQKLEFDSVIKDAKAIYKVRMQELEENPYKMKLRGNRLPDFLEGLNMFNCEEGRLENV